MKSLYESILGSTRTGKAGEAIKVVEWFKSTLHYQSFLKSGSRNYQSFFESADVKATPKGAYWIIDMDGDTSVSMDSIKFYKADTPNGSGVLPYNIYCVRVNGKITNISYNQLKFKDSIDMVQEVRESVTFTGCEIGKLDRLPKGCTEVIVNYMHAIGGGYPTSIKEIKDIKLKKIIQSNIFRGGLSCMLSNIKNISVTDEMYICDEMLGYYSLDKGNSKFKPEASEMLTEFFKNNKVDPNICKFIPSDNNNTKSESGTIRFDEKTNIWRFKGDK